MNTNDTLESVHDLDLEDEEDFKTRLRSWCGLFISIYHGKVYFLHQTAREFLLADSASSIAIPLERWQHSITTHHAHTVLAEICVLYLNFFNSDTSLPTVEIAESYHEVSTHAFLNYSATAWGIHFCQADIINNAPIIPFALKICDSKQKGYSVWFSLYWEAMGLKSPSNFAGLMVASYFGHNAIVELFIKEGANIEIKDDDNRTPLAQAIEGQHVVVVKQLLAAGAKVDYHYRIVSKSG